MAWSKPKLAVAALIVLVVLNGGILVTLLLLRQSPRAPPATAPQTATLLVYEPFDYPAEASLVGQTNGVGFAGPWIPGGFNAQLSDVQNMKAGALTYLNLATRGACHVSVAAPPAGVQAIAGVGRQFPTNLATPGATYYLSFLYRLDGEDGYASVVLGTGQGRELAIGKSRSANPFHLAQRGGVGRVYTSDDAVVGQTAFLVVKMEFQDGPDRFTLHLNPIPGQPEPDTGVVKDDMDLAEATHLFLYSRAAWSVDELRLGTTWEAVTPARKPDAR